MTYVPSPATLMGPGVPQLESALARLHELVVDSLNLAPTDWESPSAQAYRDTVMELATQVRSSAADVDEAIAAARYHGTQLAQVRQALASGGPVAV